MTRTERRRLERMEGKRAAELGRLKLAGLLRCSECWEVIEPDEDSMSLSLDGPNRPLDVRHMECWLADCGP